MSHLVNIKTQIKNMECVKRAAEYLAAQDNVQVTFIEGGTPRFWGGQQNRRADYTLNLPGKYDLGFKQSADGETYEFMCEAYLLTGQDRLGSQLIGHNGDRLLQEYAFQEIAYQHELRGESVERSVNASGELVALAYVR